MSEPLLIYAIHGVVLFIVQFPLYSPNYIFLLAEAKTYAQSQKVFYSCLYAVQDVNCTLGSFI